MENDLKPCPLCGGPGQLKICPKPYRHGWVGCSVCGLYINWNNAPEGAVKKWNRRAPSGSFTAALTSDAIELLRFMPEALNRLADRLIDGLEDAVLWGGTPRGEEKD